MKEKPKNDYTHLYKYFKKQMKQLYVDKGGLTVTGLQRYLGLNYESSIFIYQKFIEELNKGKMKLPKKTVVKVEKEEPKKDKVRVYCATCQNCLETKKYRFV